MKKFFAMLAAFGLMGAVAFADHHDAAKTEEAAKAAPAKTEKKAKKQTKEAGKEAKDTKGAAKEAAPAEAHPQH